MKTAFEIFCAIVVELLTLGVVGVLLYRVVRGVPFFPQRRTLLPFNKGVLFHGERLVKVLDPGTYWIRPRRTIVPIDVRPRPFQTPPRELLTGDRQGLRVRLNGEYRVVDPVSFIRGSNDGHTAFYLSLEREIALSIAELDRSDILDGRVSVADRIRERIEPRAAQLGIELLHMEVSDLLPIAWLQQLPNL